LRLRDLGMWPRRKTRAEDTVYRWAEWTGIISTRMLLTSSKQGSSTVRAVDEFDCGNSELDIRRRLTLKMYWAYCFHTPARKERRRHRELRTPECTAGSRVASSPKCDTSLGVLDNSIGLSISSLAMRMNETTRSLLVRGCHAHAAQGTTRTDWLKSQLASIPEERR